MNVSLRLAALTIAVLPMLQGCFPLAVTAVGGGVLMASDRRTAGTYVEDEGIELKCIGALREYNGRGGNISATSYNRRVLLTGQAPTEDLKREAEAAVRRVDNVRDVVNELEIAGASSLASRGNDALITSNIKARTLNNGKFTPNHVKVVTEANTVFLMGLVFPGEAEAAVEIARGSQGVTRVVKVFEYLK